MYGLTPGGMATGNVLNMNIESVAPGRYSDPGEPARTTLYIKDIRAGCRCRHS